MKQRLTLGLSGVGVGVALALGAGTAQADDDPPVPMGFPFNDFAPTGQVDPTLFGLTSLEDAAVGTFSGYQFVTVDQLFDQFSPGLGLDATLMGVDGFIPIGFDQLLKDLSLGQWAGLTDQVPDFVGYVGTPDGSGVIGSAGDHLLDWVNVALAGTADPDNFLAHVVDGSGTLPALTSDVFDPGLALSAAVVDIGDLLALI